MKGCGVVDGQGGNVASRDGRQRYEQSQSHPSANPRLNSNSNSIPPKLNKKKTQTRNCLPLPFPFRKSIRNETETGQVVSQGDAALLLCIPIQVNSLFSTQLAPQLTRALSRTRREPYQLLGNTQPFSPSIPSTFHPFPHFFSTSSGGYCTPLKSLE